MLQQLRHLRLVDGATLQIQRSFNRTGPRALGLLILWIPAFLTGCRAFPLGPYEYQVAGPWELKGPFKVFEKRSAVAQPEEPEQSRPSEEISATSPSADDADAARDETPVEEPPAKSPPMEGLPVEGGAVKEVPDPNPPSRNTASTASPPESGSFSLRPSHIDVVSTEDPYLELPGLFSHGRDADESFWYLDMGLRMGYIRLRETRRELEARLNPVLKLDAVDMFTRPYTPLDRKTDFGMQTSYYGIGRREADWFTWNFYLGGGAGGDYWDEAVGPIQVDVDFNYFIIFSGLTADIYPWGKPLNTTYPNWRERLYGSRPYLLTGIESGVVNAEGRGFIRIWPIKVYRDRQPVNDILFSTLFGLGWEVPVDSRWSLGLSVHYTFHVYRPDEYNGWNVTYALRYKF